MLRRAKEGPQELLEDLLDRDESALTASLVTSQLKSTLKEQELLDDHQLSWADVLRMLQQRYLVRDKSGDSYISPYELRLVCSLLQLRTRVVLCSSTHLL